MNELMEQPQAPQPEIILSREKMLEELLDWGSRFINSSAEWRKNSYEENWRRWQRYADAIYDASLAAKKEKWQSKVTWPIAAAQKENAMAKLFQIELGAKPPLEYKSRLDASPQAMPGMPPPVDQGQLIRDLVLWEREKADYETERNKVNDDRTTYGSGFMRARFETDYQERKVKVPDYAPIDVFDRSTWPMFNGGQRKVIGYHDEIQQVVVYRGVKLEHISIWDIFPDPKALQIKGHPIAHRYDTTYGEVLAGIEEGYYLPEAAEKLRNLPSDEEAPEDKKQVESDRGIADYKVERPDYGKVLECFEIQARLPKKWVLINGEDIDDPEKLVSARVRIKKGVCVVSVELSDTYDGEPDIEKDDYFPVAGQFYARGIPEMAKDAQMVASETVNQRLDSGSIGLRQRFAVMEKALVDPKDIDEDRTVIRVKAPIGGGLDDVNKAVQRIDMGGPERAAFVEPQEWERILQERTSITRATLSGANAQNDGNRTLGGLEMQQSVTGDKMGYLGALSEYGFQRRISHRIWALIYQNYGPEDYALALGPEKASQIILMSPEAVAQNFRLIPKGIFETENRPKRQAMVAALQQQYGMMPWFNTLGAAKSQIGAMGEDEATFILPEAEATQIMAKAQEIGAGMAEQMVQQKEQEDLAKRAEKGAAMDAKGDK